MEKTKDAIMSTLTAEIKILYKEISKWISKHIRDPKPDVIHCTYHIVDIKGNQYAYRVQYNPNTQKASTMYLGKVSVNKEEYRAFKEKERKFKKLIKAHKHVEYHLTKVVEK